MRNNYCYLETIYYTYKFPQAALHKIYLHHLKRLLIRKDLASSKIYIGPSFWDKV